MEEIVNQVIKTFQQTNDWARDDVVLLALSGGVDSMALLDLFLQLTPEERPQIIALHVHHHLREEANLDCQFVEEYCSTRDVPFVVKHWEPDIHPATNIESAARQFRYAFFAEQMEALDAKVLVTAHHADDQMETILMRLTRGSTLEGYAGIQKKRPFHTGVLIRPLLHLEKESLYTYCEKRDVPFREDHTNQEMTYTRNRFRQNLLPPIKSENRQASKHFQEFSEDLNDLLEVAMPVIEAAYHRSFTGSVGKWTLAISTFQEETEVVQRFVLGYFLQQIWQREGVSFQRSHIRELQHLIKSSSPQSELVFAGGIVRKRYDKLFFLPKKRAQQTKLDFEQELTQNEWLELPFNGKIGLFSINDKNVENSAHHKEAYYIRMTPSQLPLSIRKWRAGDRISLNRKASFTKKVSRLFIDRKLPQEVRDQTLVLEDATGTILWVVGVAPSVHLARAEETIIEAEKNNKSSYLLLRGSEDQ
ncbi:tRNA lysidine(34) synthetase TilS [Jeotgalibaca caeni]|uniref:tRNA lysidine(34) synthetase TilS n=1 Tax=Jeotgalibaca caeni TaxID=3028623 RepID=UPI00237D5803|nr:tRNA lysidine(34) synthetase TilS [Jeotgalibaca caeni]MDE1548067.1 tRNA lysidine(34) synthetase TilS [Jeotgalibaca caeni]